MGDDWVVDSLLGYLQSPTWRYPVDNFIEQNCTVFDAEDENKFSYTDIHKGYREMVDKLLESFISDLGITPRQLADACSQSSTLGESHQSLFEHILATEDFLLFKSIMVQKNIDLELQALKLVQRQLGFSPEAYQPGARDDQETVEKMKKSRRLAEEEDERILQEVLEQSRKEYERQMSQDEEEMQKQLTLAKQESLKSIEVSQQKDKLELASSLQNKLEVSSSLPAELKGNETKTEEKDKMSKSLPSDELKKDKQALPSLASSKPSTGSSGISDAASLWLESAKADASRERSISGSKPTIAHNIQDIKAREAYLRQQRDHLLKMKSKTRAERVNTHSVIKSPSKAASARSSERSSKKESVPKETHSPSRKDATGTGGEGDGMRHSNTGVLCSAIADKLMKEQK